MDSSQEDMDQCPWDRRHRARYPVNIPTCMRHWNRSVLKINSESSESAVIWRGPRLTPAGGFNRSTQHTHQTFQQVF
ncbi:hypothetical protein EZI45_28735 [Delftia tsuruhatensis]|nr:hypothetical protein EZI45_28735 [Delftia tsuruhatensis]